MMRPLVSIIIPTYNRTAIIQKTLDSVLRQTYKHWECLVIDDGSTDNTFELLQGYQKKDSRIRFFKRHREPKGAPTCRNIGLEHSKGDYIVYLDSDDYLLPFCLEQRVKAVNQFPDCDFLVFPMGELKKSMVIKREIPEYEDYLIPFLSANLPWSIMCPIWKQDFLNQLEGFTEGYIRFNDPELTIRALLESNVNYKVFNNLPYDCVLVPSPKQETIFHKNVYQGIKIFIPDMAKLLFAKDMKHNIQHLVMYLRLWLKYYYAPQPKGKFWYSINLITMFYGENIISFKKWMELNLRLCHFHCNHIFGFRNIDKLTNMAYFITKKH